MRHTLLTKALQTAPTGGPSVTNPATLSRPEHVQMDEGRPWAGDLYDYGAVSDPSQAFASFGDQADGDVEAWLDKGDDGVLIGWVRDGEDVYRYSDPEAWSIDVDGAGLLRTDGGAATMEGEAVPAGAGDELVAEGEEMLADASTADTSIGDADPTAFEEEDDDALVEGDPTEALEDPTDPMVEEATGDGGPDAQGAFADMLSDDTLPPAAGEHDPDAEEDELEYEDEDEDPEGEVTAVGVPAAIPPTDVEEDPAPEPTEEPEGEEPADDEPDAEEPTDAEGEEDDDEVLTIAPEDLPTADDEDPDEDPDAEDDEDEEDRKNRPFERKHYRGDHNQDTHGRRYSIGARKPRARTSGGSDTGGDSPKGSTTSGGVAAKPAPAAGKRIALSEQSIASMSEKDLDAIMHDDKVYDDDTMMRAAVEYDKRKPLDDAWAKAYDATEPGSVEEHKMRREVIPSEWLAWAAVPSRKPKRSVMQQREDEWLSFIQAQYLAALDATNGQFFAARYRAKPPFGEMAFFDGTAGVQQARKYMSPELKEWWDTHGVTKSEFMAEFSDKAKAAQANIKRDDLHA